jgi:hypothetical protein
MFPGRHKKRFALEATESAEEGVAMVSGVDELAKMLTVSPLSPAFLLPLFFS